MMMPTLRLVVALSMFVTLSVVLAPASVAVPGNLTLASTSDTGIKGNGASDIGPGFVWPSLSADGVTVAFSSEATNLDPADTDSLRDVYVKDLVTGDLTLVSTSDTGVKGNAPSDSASISADGRMVSFSSEATNLDPADTDSLRDVYVKDLVTADLTLVSTSDTGVKSNGPSGGALSPDGTRLGFWSQATNLDPSDTDLNFDVYVKDLTSGDLTLISTSDAGTKGNNHSVFSALSADGTVASFWSVASNLDPADTDSIEDVYVKNLLTGELTLASTSETGIKGDDTSDDASLSEDGTIVAFASFAGNLDGADPDHLQDVYVKNLVTGELTLASTSDTGIKGNLDSNSPSLSADGSRVAFRSLADNLDPADIDAVLYDVYVKDLVTGDLMLGSSSDAGTDANDGNGGPSVSADGTRVAFTSVATNLDPADTDLFIPDVYVKELGQPPILAADLAVTIADKPDPVRVGQTVTYRMTIKNQGPDEAIGVTLLDLFPSGSRFVSASPSQGSCTVNGKQRTVNCDLGSLAAGTSATVNLVVRPNLLGTIANSASVSANETDPSPANNSDTESTSVA
jgi:uncharacterized repeat protein (TIGR01451 family)